MPALSKTDILRIKPEKRVLRVKVALFKERGGYLFTMSLAENEWPDASRDCEFIRWVTDVIEVEVDE